MHYKKVVLSVCCVAMATVLGYFIGTRGNSEHASAPIIKTYTVPPGRSKEIRYRLDQLFRQGEDQPLVGSAQLFGEGLMLVRAPEEFQTGIAHLIEGISHQGAPPKNPVHIDYWLITGNEAKVSNGQEFKSLTPVLSSIAKVDGPRKFRILEHLSSNSASGQRVKVKGTIAEAKTTANYADGHFLLDVEVNSPLGSIESSTEIQPGDYIILGENSLKPKDLKLHDENKFSGEREDQQTNVYHVIHAEFLK
jgi:hypothetical protein